MRVRACTHTQTHTYTDTHLCIYTYLVATHTDRHTLTQTHICVYTHTLLPSVYKCMYNCYILLLLTHKQTCVCVYVHRHRQTFVCIHTSDTDTDMCMYTYLVAINIRRHIIRRPVGSFTHNILLPRPPLPLALMPSHIIYTILLCLSHSLSLHIRT